MLGFNEFGRKARDLEGVNKDSRNTDSRNNDGKVVLGIDLDTIMYRALESLKAEVDENCGRN